MTTVVQTKKGDNLQAVFPFTADGVAVNLNGCTAKMQLRTTDLGLVATATTDDGSLSVDGAAGEVTSNIPAATMANVAPGQYLADIQLTYLDGTVKSSDTFVVLVLQDYTYTE